ncbi:MAG: hypothetical protein ACT452_18025, partial [Microthrixaceae bacterium]
MQARPTLTTPRARRVVALAVEHPVLAVVVAALVVRILVAIVISATGTVDTVAPDSRFYMYIADHVARIQTYQEFEKFDGPFATYILPVSWLFRVFGSHLFLAQGIAIAYAAIAAAAATRLALELVPRAWALAAGAIVAFYPSQVLWSSVPLRDSAAWATVSCLALTVVLVSRARSLRQLALVAGSMTVLLYLVGHVRYYSLAVAAIALALTAIVIRPARYRVAIPAIMISIAVVVPIVVGTGPLGLNLTEYDLPEIRATKAEEAESAIVPTDVDDSSGSTLRHLPRGLTVVLVEPVPWTSLRGETVRAGQVEAPLWWRLLLSAARALPLLWRTRSVLAF